MNNVHCVNYNIMEKKIHYHNEKKFIIINK